MKLDFEALADRYAISKTCSWEEFRNLWIEMKFNRLQETLFNSGKNRSETVVYTVYLRQCYYEILKSFVVELDFFKATAYIYSLYSVYFTQLGLVDNDEDYTASLPVVSIPIDLNCMKIVSVFVSTCLAMNPVPKDVLTAVNHLRTSNAFLCCARMQSFAESKKFIPSELSESTLSSLLKLDVLESLEKEYKESSNVEITNAIKQVIQELPTNTEPSNEASAPTKPRERNTGEKRGQHYIQIEAYRKKERRS